MDAIRDDIDIIIKKELEAANKAHPPFASLHEAYAVIKEEFEETTDELGWAEKYLESAWCFIKSDSTDHALGHIARAKFAATNAAIEACQTVAMCQKAIDSIKSGK